MLYVYSTEQISELRQKVTISDSILPDSVEKNDEESAFEITSKHDWKTEENLTTITEDAINKKVSSTNNMMGDDDEFDFDDI